MTDRRRGIHELYENDPERADQLLWGRRTDPVSRRGFLKGSGLAAMSAAVGASIPFAHLMPGGLIPAALAQTDQSFSIAGKEGLIVLNDRHLHRVLSDYVTYYKESRTHLGLEKECPVPRAVEPPEIGPIKKAPVLGGLHHRYFREAA